jgi:hypothetical protein
MSVQRRRQLVDVARYALIMSLAFALWGLGADRATFLRAFLWAYCFLATVGLGSLFFVLLHYLTRARWSSGAVRDMGHVASILPWCTLLFLHLIAWSHEFYPWSRPTPGEPVTAHDWYFAPSFWGMRSLVCLGAWALLTWAFVGGPEPLSRWFGREGDSMTLWRQRWSGPAMVVFGLTTTSAAFDWLMSLQSQWQSAVFGVYVFAGAVSSALAVLGLVTVVRRRLSPNEREPGLGVEHDVGKLLFGFLMFWGYIAFSQYLLLWYGGIGEETEFYRRRWEGAYRSATLWLVLLHFVLPFALLLSRRAKRSAWILGGASALLIVAHAVDLGWLVFPVLFPAGVPSSPGLWAGALVAFSALGWVTTRALACRPEPSTLVGFAPLTPKLVDREEMT